MKKAISSNSISSSSSSSSSTLSSDTQILIKNGVSGHRRTPSGLFSRLRRSRAMSLLVAFVVVFVLLSFWTLSSGEDEDWRNQKIEKCPYTEDRIPKRLHQMWINNTIPDKWKVSQKACKTLNKDYEYFLWTDEKMLSFITKHYSWFLPTYRSYSYPIQRVDAARYFILYHYGGVYIDLDLQCKFSSDEMIEKLRNEQEQNKGKSTFRVVLAETLPDGVTNAVMMTNPCSPFFKQLITSLTNSNKWYVFPYPTVIFSTGPMFLTIALSKYPNRETDVHRFSNHDFRDVYFIHKQGSSWHSWDGKIIHAIDHWSEIAAVIIIPLLIIISVITYFYYKRYRLRQL